MNISQHFRLRISFTLVSPGLYSLITMLLLICCAFGVVAKKQNKNYPRAEIKVNYEYHHPFLQSDGEITERVFNYTLLANSYCSKYYNYNNEFLDSLDSTPQGRKLHNQLMTIGVDQYIKNGDDSAIPRRKGQLYVYKSLRDSVTTVYDTYGLGEQGYYNELFKEIEWVLTDSTKNILGYECVRADTDYHGRHWTAWFAPEIPLQDGPWKLCGLPGLILEASDYTGQYSFIATAIENCDQEMFPIYQPTRYDKMNRIDMLKAYAEYRKNASSISRALIMNTPDGSKIDMEAPKQQKQNFTKLDFLETDYH